MIWFGLSLSLQFVVYVKLHNSRRVATCMRWSGMIHQGEDGNACCMCLTGFLTRPVPWKITWPCFRCTVGITSAGFLHVWFFPPFFSLLASSFRDAALLFVAMMLVWWVVHRWPSILFLCFLLAWCQEKWQEVCLIMGGQELNGPWHFLRRCWTLRQEPWKVRCLLSHLGGSFYMNPRTSLLSWLNSRTVVNSESW